jgi:hypothetical protein
MSELWEGYAQQEVVLLEDMDPYHIKLGYHLKIWADRYSFRGRVLFGSIVLRPKKIVITSQYHPHEIWGNDQKTVDAITDRFNIRVLEAREKPAGEECEARKRARTFLEDKSMVPDRATCEMCYIHPCVCTMIIDDCSDTEIIEIEDEL